MNSVLAHKEILLTLDKEVHPKSSDFKSFKVMSTAYLDRAIVDGCTDCYGICSALEKKGYISVGNYTVLKQILSTVNLILLLNKIEAKEKEYSTIFEHHTPQPVEPMASSFYSTVSNVELRMIKTIQNSDACKDWRMLGRDLDISDPDLDAIAHDNPQHLKEQCYQMLKTWLQQKGTQATPEVLIDVLKDQMYTQVAEDLQKITGTPVQPTDI